MTTYDELQRKQQISAWALHVAWSGDENEEEFEDSYFGYMKEAELRFAVIRERHLSESLTAQTINCPNTGEAWTTYQKNGFQIVETASGYTIRPILSNYNERAFYPFPYVERHQATELRKLHELLRQAWTNVRQSKSLYSTVNEICLVGEADINLGKRLYMHWNAVCEYLDQVETHDLWQGVYDFCRQKSDYFQSPRIHINAGNALRVYSFSGTAPGAEPALDIDKLAELAPDLDWDIAFVIREIERVLERHFLVGGRAISRATSAANIKKTRSNHKVTFKRLAEEQTPRVAPPKALTEYYSTEISDAHANRVDYGLPTNVRIQSHTLEQ